jgi:hypothetical protein
MRPDQSERGGDRKLAGETNGEAVWLVSELVADGSGVWAGATGAAYCDPLDGERRVGIGRDRAEVAVVKEYPRRQP